MSAVGETTVVVLGAQGLIPWALIAAGRLNTARARRASTSRTTAASVTADSTPVTEAAGRPDELVRLVRTEAVARSRANPGLAEFAAQRRRDPKTGQFLPIGRAS